MAKKTLLVSSNTSKPTAISISIVEKGFQFQKEDKIYFSSSEKSFPFVPKSWKEGENKPDAIYCIVERNGERFCTPFYSGATRQMLHKEIGQVCEPLCPVQFSTHELTSKSICLAVLEFKTVSATYNGNKYERSAPVFIAVSETYDGKKISDEIEKCFE